MYSRRRTIEAADLLIATFVTASDGECGGKAAVGSISLCRSTDVTICVSTIIGILTWQIGHRRQQLSSAPVSVFARGSRSGLESERAVATALGYVYVIESSLRHATSGEIFCAFPCTFS